MKDSTSQRQPDNRGMFISLVLILRGLPAANLRAYKYSFFSKSRLYQRRILHFSDLFHFGF